MPIPEKAASAATSIIDNRNLTDRIAMASTTIIHRGITIATLTANEQVEGRCAPGHMAIREQADGWWLYFVDQDGSVSGYDTPYPSHQHALWAAKAAAEFSAE